MYEGVNPASVTCAVLCCAALYCGMASFVCSVCGGGRGVYGVLYAVTFLFCLVGSNFVW